MPKPKAPKPTAEELLKHQEMTLASRPPQLLDRIKELAVKQLELEAKKDKLSEDLKENNIAIEVVRGGPGQEGELPAAMQEAEIEEFTLGNGACIAVAINYSMPSMAADSEKRQPMIDWLEKNGHSGMVKNAVTVLFEKGDKRIEELEAFLELQKMAHDKFSSVNAQSLKALIKGLLEDGDDVPLEELGIGVYRQSKVK